ncbi:MAG: transposase [Legionella sp.]|nr:MAG: transposase [Legionella sp.]
MTKSEDLSQLMQAISLLQTAEEAHAFFNDLCTLSELESMADRWQVALLLKTGMPYRLIYEKTGVSMTTITRVARALTLGNGGYQIITERQKNDNI